MDNNCFYCMKDQRLKDLMIEIGPLDHSTLYLFREQTYRGRCVVAYHRHVRHLTDLTETEVAGFFADITRVARALMKTFGPAKVNYGIYGDTNPHLHCHIVPKYDGGPNWGGTFEMMPSPKQLLGDTEYETLIMAIRKNL